MARPSAARTVSDSVWIQALVALVAVRVMIPLVALAATPSKVPLLPQYPYVPLNGDAFGSYHAIANLFEAFTTVLIGWVGGGALVMTICFSAAAVILWRAGVRWLAVLLPALAVSLVAAELVYKMADSEAGVIGWSLAWALALAPLPILGISLTPDSAFPSGLAVSLIANGVTVVATALVGVRATGRRSIGLAAAGLYATWPLWVGIVAGAHAWDNGQWFVDVGLHLYSEPLSTALVVLSLAILLDPRLTSLSTAVAGLLLGFSTAVKLPNGFVAAALVVTVALRFGGRRAAILVLGGLVSMPIILGFWSKGYVDSSGGGGVDLGALYQLQFIWANAKTSSIFTVAMLILIVPLAAAGLAFPTDWYRRATLAVPVVATLAAFSAYYVTNQHPRFYYVMLPPLFVLQAAGATVVWSAAKRRRLRPAKGVE